MRAGYRADIDGLRGIAVLSVLLFHARVSRFSGGYVGVDVFFVISGYLITSTILPDIRAHTFSIAAFYERRIRRILPALFLTILLSAAAAAFLLIPANLKALSDSIVAVALFVSNVRFWRDSGYFDAPAEHKPLLHTWSLAVEEQFYILFPLFLIGVRRFGRSRFALWLSVAAIGSLALSEYATRYMPVAAFYLAPARAWELIVGALVACDALPAAVHARTRNVAAAVGIALIVASVIGYNSSIPFPGIAAIVPTVGAALIAHAGTKGDTFISRMLSIRPLVFIGLISYSLYLLHWPLLVFGKYYLIRGMTLGVSAGLLLASFALATLSWRFVERPLRSLRMRRRPLFGVAAAAITVTIGASAYVHVEDGLPRRFPYGGPWSTACDERRPEDPNGLCTLGLSASPTFLLWGDSHAAALAPGIDSAALRTHAAGYQAHKSGCPPLVGVEVRWTSFPNLASCAAFNQDVLRYIGSRPALRTIILASRWAMFASGHGYGVNADSTIALSATYQIDAGSETAADLFRLGLDRTVRQLRALGRRVVLVDPIPEVGYEVPEALFIAQRTGRDVNDLIGPTPEQYRARNRIVLDVLNRFRGVHDVREIDVAQRMCTARRCTVSVSGRPLYQDDQHLSLDGSQYLSGLFDELFTPSPGFGLHARARIGDSIELPGDEPARSGPR